MSPTRTTKPPRIEGFTRNSISASLPSWSLKLFSILSFSFRLFGNIFAGSILLFVVGTLVPVFLQSGVLLFEWFVGIIQAIVFGLLTLIFMSLATAGHGDEEGH